MTSIGFHTGPGGNANGIGQHWQQLHAAGIPFFVKSADHYGFCFEAANIARGGNVPHTIVFRLTTAGQGNGLEYDVPPYDMTPHDAAAFHWTITKNKLPPEFDKEQVWLEPINEVDKGRADWLGHFAAEIGTLAMSEGYKVSLFGWSSGEPEPEHWQTEGMRRYLTMCAAHPDKLAVALHEYSYTVDNIDDKFPYRVGRFQFLFAACDAMGIARPTVHITEWGWAYQGVPSPEVALAHIDWAYRLYAPHPQIKGVAIWYLGAGFGGVADQAQKLIAPVTQFMLNAPAVDPAPPPVVPPVDPPPAVPYLHVRLIAPANIRRDPSTNNPAITPVAVKEGLELIKVGQVSGQTVSGNNQWVKAVAFISRPYATASTTGKVKTNRSVNLRVVPTTAANWPLVLLPAGVEFEHLGNVDDLYNDGQWAAVALYVWKPLTADVDPGIRLGKLLPGTLSVTSPFNSPRPYAGEHEGLDFAAPIGTAVYPGANGVVDGVRTVDPGTGYGKYVRVKYGSERYKAWFGHLSRVDVTVGQTVTAGQQIGLSGNSGGSTGPHLHLTLQDIPAGLDNFIVDNVTDPTLYLHPAVSLHPTMPLPDPAVIDLLPYLRGDGRIYTVRHPDGNQEDFQSQSEGNVFYQVKNSQWEALKYDDQWIYRGLDTSPGPAPADAERPGALRYYRQFEPGQQWARWCPRFMAVGQAWTGTGHQVQFAYKSDCSPSAKNSGGATNKATLVAKHASATWNGILVHDVVQLLTATGETMYYGRGYGLVAWGADWGSSGIVELSPAGRPPLEREMGCFA